MIHSQNERARQIARVAGSGVFATAVDVAGLLLLVEILGVPVLLSVVIATGMGAMANFYLNRTWAFGNESNANSTARQLGSFALVAIGSSLGVAATVYVLGTLLGIPYLVAKGFGAVVVFASWSYPLQRRFVFA